VSLKSLHLLLSYQCTMECDHCFVWGSPCQSGTMTLEDVVGLLDEAERLGTIESVYFEGGEPFLFYPILLAAVREAASRGFGTGVVTNAYWASDARDAEVWLRPFAGALESLSVSADPYHGTEAQLHQARAAEAAANQLGIPVGTISIAQPDDGSAPLATGTLPSGESAVMCRGRAAATLADRMPHADWRTYTACPFEELADPQRVHIDPVGYIELCQGISAGSWRKEPLSEAWSDYDPTLHPIVAPLREGGPSGLVRAYALPMAGEYADACHLCDAARRALRERFPEALAPDQMYGVVSA